MLLSFKNKKGKGGQNQHLFHDKVAAGIVKKCIRVQTKWANYMQHKTERLSPKARKYYLLFFCFFSAGCSLYLVVESFTVATKKDLGVASINIPVHSTQTGEENARSFQLITKKEFERIARFHHYMDSLGRSVSGAKIRDSFLSLRPGLMDSIRVIEKLYQLQTSKK